MTSRPRIPRQALLAATVGAFYSILLLPLPVYPVLGVSLAGVAWFLLSVSLLYVRTFSYYAYTTWALLWVVWKSVEAYRTRDWRYFLDVLLPTVSVVLLVASTYLAVARGQDAAQDDDEASA